MSALEPGLMAQLVAEQTPAERALQKILTLYQDNSRMSCTELRVLEIALEGLGVAPAHRRVEIEAAIQRKRDRLALLRGWVNGGSNAPP